MLWNAFCASALRPIKVTNILKEATKMKLLRNLLWIVPFVYVVTASGTTLGVEPDEEKHFIHEVAHPRACVLMDSGETRGAAENFAHGNGNELFVLQGTTVYFKSGFGYEGVWYDDAAGTLSTKIEVYLDDEYVDMKEDKMTAMGPKIESGSVNVPITFDEMGEFTVRSDLTTKVQTADESETTLAEDMDSVTTYVVVGEPGISLLYPENESTLFYKPPPTFEWQAYGFKRFQLQLSTSENFDSEETMMLPPFGGTKRTWMRMRRRLWKVILQWDKPDGVVYWRVIGKAKNGEEGESDTWHFSIED
jgi:hypothetical protein